MLMMTRTERGVKAAWQELERQSVEGDPKPWVSPEDGLIEGHVDMTALVRAIIKAGVSHMSDRPVKTMIDRLYKYANGAMIEGGDLQRAAVYLENLLVQIERLKEEQQNANGS